MECRVVAKERVVADEVIKRFAAESTKASAKLEHRAVPADYVRTPEIEQFLAEHRSAA